MHLLQSENDVIIYAGTRRIVAASPAGNCRVIPLEIEGETATTAMYRD